MVEAWFAILCLMIIFFVVLEGWDFGAGILHYVVARNQEERRLLIASIGPLWSWNEVWLVGTGGVLFAAFPKVLATAFPAYYLPIFLVLWALILRGISLEFRGHIFHSLWMSFWDFTFSASNILLANLFGAALGNIIRGMPIAPDMPLTLPLFTNFGVHGNVGILDWYTVSVAAFSVVCLAAHGASYLAIKSEGEVYRRSKILAARLWPLTALLLLLVTAETLYVRPQLFYGIVGRPFAWATLAFTLGGIAAIIAGIRSGADRWVFFGGCALIAGLLATAAASLFPVMLHSTLQTEYSLTAWNGSTDHNNLVIAAYWWPLAFAFALAYFVFIGKHYSGRVQLSKDTQRPY